MGLLIPKMLGHAKALSEDYLHQVKKKTLGLDAICLWIPPFSYYLLHVPVRIIPVALLFAYFQGNALALILAQLICNLLIRYMLFESGVLTMDAYHAMSSIVAPTSFGANDETEVRQFRRWNCLTYAANLTLVTMTLNLLSEHDVISMNPAMAMEALRNHHYGNNNNTMGPDEPMSQKVMAVGSLFAIVASALLSVLSGIFAYHRCSCVEGMQEPLNEKVLVLEKIFIECGCKNNDDGMSAVGAPTFGIEMQPCLISSESLKVDEVAEEATESVIDLG